MNPATHGTEGSASAPVLYMALELSNKSWRLAFGDVPQQVHAVAGRSLYAHLIKLAHAGRVTEKDAIQRAGEWAKRTPPAETKLDKLVESAARRAAKRV